MRVTVTDVLTKVCAQALMRHREVNAEFTEDAILLHPSANVGLAVAAPQGLVVPVIRGAERLSLAEIAGARADLVGRARDNKLRAEDLEGGTFTISNLGMYAVESFTAVLNPPQAAIVAVGATEDARRPGRRRDSSSGRWSRSPALRPPRRRRRARRRLPPDPEGEPRGSGARAVRLRPWRPRSGTTSATSTAHWRSGGPMLARRPAGHALPPRHAPPRLPLARSGDPDLAALPLRQELGPARRRRRDRIRTARTPYGAAWYRLFPARAPGFGFVDEQTPELTIAVVPSHRGHGTGAELLEALLERARADGFARISLSAEPGQTGFYEKHGFRERRPRGRNRDDGRGPLITLTRNATREMSMEVDVAVLGGGPGGYTAAIRAAQLGAKVACIEKEPELGGTCLRVGCIPTKAWVQTAFALKEAEESFAKFGVDVGEATLDFAASNAWKAGVVKQMTTGVAGLFKANGVEWVKGAGTFKDANTIAVEGGEDVTFTSAIVATGLVPAAPADRGARLAALRRLDRPARAGVRCRGGSSSSAAASSAASSPRSSAASAAR